MKRKFNTFSQIQIKNKDTEKDFHIPLYQNRKSISEIIPPQQKEIFDIGAFGSSAYYYKNTLGMNVEVSDLYDDGDEPVPPVENKLKIVNNSSVTFKFRVKDAGISISVASGESIDIELTEDVYGNPAKISASDSIAVDAFFVGIYREEEVDTQLYVDVQEESTYIGDPKGGEQDWQFRDGDYGILTINNN